MKRRAFLTGVTLSTAAVTGCLSGAGDQNSPSGDDIDDAVDGVGSRCDENSTTSDETRARDNDTDETRAQDGDTDGYSSANHEGEYERCNRTYVGVHFDLPEPAETEAVAAIEEGTYETTDTLVLPQAVDIDEAYLTRSENSRRRYYTAAVEEDGDVTRLLVTETIPETDPVSVCNDTDEDVTVEIRLEYAATLERDVAVETEGDVVFEEQVTLGAGQEVALDGVTYRYGSYRAVVVVDALQIDNEVRWRMWHEYSRHGTVHLGADGELFYTHSHYHPEGEMPSCEWSEDGELIDGPGEG